MRGDKTFAYDLVMGHGAVSSRVVLLLRSAEAKPPTLSFVEKHPLAVLSQGTRGGLVRDPAVAGSWAVWRESAGKQVVAEWSLGSLAREPHLKPTRSLPGRREVGSLERKPGGRVPLGAYPAE